MLVLRDQRFWKCCEFGSKEGSEILTRIWQSSKRMAIGEVYHYEHGTGIFMFIRQQYLHTVKKKKGKFFPIRGKWRYSSTDS